MSRISLAVVLACLILPSSSFGQQVDLTLVDFLQDFSDTQGDNGITYAALPTEPGDSPRAVAFNPAASFANGSQRFEGPGFIGPGALPHLQQETSREFLAMHPHSTNGISIQYTIETAGTVRISGDFARANDFRNAGDGVNVGVYLNNLETPVFESSISSDHAVDSTIDGDVFVGTGSVSFDELVSVQENDILLVAVFAGDNSDAGFDVTAFRGTVSAVPLVNFFQDFSDTQGDNGITYVALPNVSGDSPPALTFSAGITLGNGTQTFEGPGFIAPGGAVIPYVQQELSREFLALHPSAANGVSIQYAIETTGTIRVSGDFARASDFLNTGDGVDVGIYLNDLDTPVFERSISSNHEVDSTVDGDVFAGTGSVPFDELVSVEENDILLVAVFAGDNSDAGFDVTAFRGIVSEVPGLTLIPDERNVGGDASQVEDFREILSSNEVLSVVGQPVDDDLNAIITFDLTIDYNTLANGNGNLAFSAFQMFSAGREAFAAGNWFQGTHWGGFFLGGVDSFPSNYTFDIANGIFADDNSENGLDLLVDDPRSIQLEFQYIAGGDDLLTARFNGQEFTTVGSYEFDQLAVRSGLNGEQSVDFTNMSIAVTLVPILGDVNQDGVVDFSDIPAFIAVLQAGTFLEEADTNSDGEVNFADIPVFIAILSAN